MPLKKKQDPLPGTLSEK